LLEFTISGSDPDGDGDITYGAVGLPADAEFSSTTGVFSWTPSVGKAGNRSVTFSVTDTGTPPLTTSETIIVTVTGENHPPQKPVITIPGNLYNISLTPDFILSEFSDPDVDDTQGTTFLQISTNSDFTNLILDENSQSTELTFKVPVSVLRENSVYFVRVKYSDNHGAESLWSDSYSFQTKHNTTPIGDFLDDKTNSTGCFIRSIYF